MVQSIYMRIIMQAKFEDNISLRSENGHLLLVCSAMLYVTVGKCEFKWFEYLIEFQVIVAICDKTSFRKFISMLREICSESMLGEKI